MNGRKKGILAGIAAAVAVIAGAAGKQTVWSSISRHALPRTKKQVRKERTEQWH